MKTTAYSAGLVSQSFWFVEFKKIIKLAADGMALADIKTYCMTENLLGSASAHRAKRMSGYLTRRAAALDSGEIAFFVETDLATQKLLNLIAILRNDRLFLTFLFEVYREKVILGQIYLTDTDANIFFKDKEMQSPIVEGWQDTTKKRLRQAYFSFLTDAGLLATEDKQHRITPPLVDSRLEQHLQAKGEQTMLQAVMGVNR